MFKCNDCGHLFEEPEELKNAGGDIGEHDYVCEVCKSNDFGEVEPCAICGEYITTGICDECIDKSIDIDTAIDYGRNDKQMLEINGFYAWVFGPRLIEEILRKYIAHADAVKYCKDDIYDFTDYLKEKAK